MRSFATCSSSGRYARRSSVRSIAADGRRSALRELPVAMLVLLARAARAGRVSADRRLGDVSGLIALRHACGCGMLSSGKFGIIEPRAAASMSAVSSSAENGIKMLGDEIGQHRKRRRLQLDLCPHQKRVTSSRIETSNRSNSRNASCLYSSMGFFCA